MTRQITKGKYAKEWAQFDQQILLTHKPMVLICERKDAPGVTHVAPMATKDAGDVLKYLRGVVATLEYLEWEEARS